jgi:anti-sigma factor RsiW
MSDHLTDEQLNEYLDGALEAGARARAAAHLSACADCAQRLRAWQAVFAQLDGLPEAPLARDLSVAVVAALQTPTPFRPRPLLRLAFAAQAVLAVTLLIGLAPFLPSVMSGLDSAAISQPVQTFAADTVYTLAAEWAALQDAAGSMWAESAALARRFTNPVADATTLMWAALLTSALALWIIGNGLLLRSTRPPRRPS